MCLHSYLFADWLIEIMIRYENGHYEVTIVHNNSDTYIVKIHKTAHISEMFIYLTACQNNVLWIISFHSVVYSLFKKKSIFFCHTIYMWDLLYSDQISKSPAGTMTLKLLTTRKFLAFARKFSTARKL